MCKETFFELCDDLRPYLQLQNFIRPSITVEIQIAASLYLLKSQGGFSLVADTYGISVTSIWRIIQRFMDAVIHKYYKQEIKFPRTEQEQQKVSDCFMNEYNFPAVGALDGTHIGYIPPKHHASDYFNYKIFYSVHLQAVVDAKCRFLNIFAGYPGRASDGGVFKTSRLGRELFQKILNEHHLIADDAYPISERILKPYSGCQLTQQQRYFNYRLSRARMIVECAFGRLKGRWRILRKMSEWEIEPLVKCIITCCILHNILEKKRERYNTQWTTETMDDEDIMRAQAVRAAAAAGGGNPVPPPPPPQQADYARLNALRIAGENKRNLICEQIWTERIEIPLPDNE